nr:hypothetical protein BaRGS_005395 [Batillaria attramentaria]
MTIPNGCLTVDNLNCCDRHYRSEVLDFWPSDDIDTVRLGVYKNGVEVQFAEFNGTGSDYKNWMSNSRLLNSSWADLKTNPKNFLSLEGDGQNSRWRRVFISRNYAGCAADRGWLVALSRWDECDWTKNIGPYPAFLFSRKSTHAVWNTKVIDKIE